MAPTAQWVRLGTSQSADAGRPDRCLDHVTYPTAVVTSGTMNSVTSHWTGLDGESRSSGLFSAPVIAAQVHGRWTMRNTSAAMATNRAP
jgi:hypothetical protein